VELREGVERQILICTAWTEVCEWNIFVLKLMF
jgi:hypothetical protein